MISRDYWLKRILNIWSKVPIVWLSGVRRVGKTTLAQEIDDIHYMNCDLPSTIRVLEDPESFYESVQKPIIVFDEVHQLEDPSRVLKIGADVYPQFKILATGSSTLAATKKFSDSLTGRKRSLHLVPVLAEELENFGILDLKERLWRGGLPPALLSEEFDHEFYAEWVDSYYARDIQELFKVEKRAGFLKLLEYIIQENGGLVELNTLAKYSSLSVPTVNNYLQVLETTHAIYRLRPYHGGGKREIIKQPKYYAFDTGFVSYYRGWENLRDKDCGALLENLVLETLQSLSSIHKIYFWRDKQQQDIDFVLPKRDGSIDTIECKWNPDGFEVGSLLKFRELYPEGRNYVVYGKGNAPVLKKFKDIKVSFIGIDRLNSEFGRV